MGDWNITIQGQGAHHNKDFPNDADKMVDRFVDELINAGHDIKSVTITYGGRQIINLGEKKFKYYEKQYGQDYIKKYKDTLEATRKVKTFLE